MSTAIEQRPDGRMFVNIPKEEAVIAPSEVVIKANKRVDDLPAEPNTTNPIALVIAYELFGLRDDAICEAMNLTANELAAAQGHAAYKYLKEIILQNVLEFQSDEVTKLFRQKGKVAASKLIDAMDNSNVRVSMKAAAEVLDRGGFVAPNGTKSVDPMTKGLNIMIINKGDSAKTVEGVSS